MFPKELRSKRENQLRGLAIGFSILVWVAGTLAFGIAIMVGLAVMMGHAIFLAHIRGNGVRLGPTQLPHLWNKVVAASQKLGMEAPPEAYLVQSGGVLNAFATKLFGRRFIILYSDLVEACEAGGATDGRASEVDFVIAHELAHLAAGHLSMWLFPFRIFLLLGPAYSRACEYTCDRAGHYFVNHLETSSRALAILAAGRRGGRMIDLDAYVEQRRDAGGFWMAVYELNSTHPYLTKRIAALREFAMPGTAPALGRNKASYPLAPMFGFAVGGPAAAPLIIAYVMLFFGFTGFTAYTEQARRLQQQRLQAQRLQAQRPEAAAAEESAANEQPGVVRGQKSRWSMQLPNPQWQLLPPEQARTQNPRADKWITRPDLDAHVMVISEDLDGSKVTVDQLAPVELDQLKKSSTHFRVVKHLLIGHGGHLYELRSTINNLPLTQFLGVFVSSKNAYEVYGFAPATSYAKVKEDLVKAIGSFTPAD